MPALPGSSHLLLDIRVLKLEEKSCAERNPRRASKVPAQRAFNRMLGRSSLTNALLHRACAHRSLLRTIR